MRDCNIIALYRQTILSFAFLCAISLASNEAAAGSRIALLVGNAAYHGAQLESPVRDVEALEIALEAEGFDVTTVTDASLEAMAEEIEKLHHAAESAEIAIFYYSGHAAGSKGETYLLPVDVDSAAITDITLRYQTLAIADVVQAVERASNLGLVLLDVGHDDMFFGALRLQKRLHLDNDSVTRTSVSGSDRIARNIIVSYSTVPGQSANRGYGKTSPYAHALATNLFQPGTPIEVALRNVAADVYELTGGRQRPYLHGSALTAVYLGLETPRSVAQPRPSPALVDSLSLFAPSPAKAWSSPLGSCADIGGAAVETTSKTPKSTEPPATDDRPAVPTPNTWTKQPRTATLSPLPPIALIPPAPSTHDFPLLMGPPSHSASAAVTPPQQQSAPIAGSRASMMEENPIDGSQPLFSTGKVAWQMMPESQSGKPPINVLRVRVEIPDRRITMTLSMQPNADPTFSASHLIEVRFLVPADFDAKGIASVPGLIMKPNEQATGSPLIGASAKITSNFFWFALAAGESDRQRNLTLLRDSGWMSVPIVYETGKRGLITFEKTVDGDRALNDALASWQQ